MVFSDDIAKVSEQVRKRVDLITGEEATKMGLIVPFFSALGYDVFLDQLSRSRFRVAYLI